MVTANHSDYCLSGNGKLLILVFCSSSRIMKIFASCHLIINGNHMIIVGMFVTIEDADYSGGDLLLLRVRNGLHAKMQTYLFAFMLMLGESFTSTEVE